MRRRKFMLGLGGGITGAILAPRLGWTRQVAMHSPSITGRGLRICVSKAAAPEVHRAAEMIASSTPTHPLLSVMASRGRPLLRGSEQSIDDGPSDLAYNHLVLVGTPDDPLIAAAWQREARETKDRIYVFGFGWLKGDIGYIESDRNPFLHAAYIPTAPFETEVVTITGTTPAGVALAAQAFVAKQLVNGAVAGSGWSRPEVTLLDRDPLAPDFTLPHLVPPTIDDMSFLAITQGGEDEYRGVLADTMIEPLEIWRAKYYKSGVWDGAGAASALDSYMAGLHRRAYGNSLWLARFADSQHASTALAKIANAAKLQGSGDSWSGIQTAYVSGHSLGERAVQPSLALQRQDAWITMKSF